MQEKLEDIKYIQNTIWAIYKCFLTDHDMKAYNREIGELTKKYTEKGDKQLLSFCQNLLISWCPIMNALAEEFRNRE